MGRVKLVPMLGLLGPVQGLVGPANGILDALNVGIGHALAVEHFLMGPSEHLQCLLRIAQLGQQLAGVEHGGDLRDLVTFGVLEPVVVDVEDVQLDAQRLGLEAKSLQGQAKI